jgi:hypothetical protein
MNLIRSLADNESVIRRSKENMKRCYLLIGEALWLIQDGNLFQSAGFKDISSYAENVHGMKRSMCYNLIKVFCEFGGMIEDNKEYQGIDVTRLIELLPVCNETNKEELLHAAVNIPDSRGWDNTIRNLKGKVATDDTLHEHDFQPVGLLQCKICGLKIKG